MHSPYTDFACYFLVYSHEFRSFRHEEQEQEAW